MLLRRRLYSVSRSFWLVSRCFQTFVSTKRQQLGEMFSPVYKEGQVILCIKCFHSQSVKFGEKQVKQMTTIKRHNFGGQPSGIPCFWKGVWEVYGSGIHCNSLHLTYALLEYEVSSRETAALRERQNNQQLALDEGTSMAMRKRQKCQGCLTL